MTVARAEQVSVDATPWYHVISRCVRRAFLCGRDRYTGRNFDHRKVWVLERVKELASVFAVDVAAYAVMSNHFHLVVRIDRERAQAWSDDEVVERFGRLFPGAVAGLEQLPGGLRKHKVALWRARLWDLDGT